MTEPDLSGWSTLRSAGVVRALAAGAEVFGQGDDADGAYVVLAGQCAVLEGDEQVNLLGPGELFGEIGSLGGGQRTASVVTVDDTELLFLSLEQLRDGFASSPDLFWESLRLIVARLGVIATRQSAYRDEHKALREIQRSLLPDLAGLDTADGLAVDAVWEPCTFASGDYYDVIRLDEHRHLIAVGDVMGHGAAASLTMAVARGQIRELARRFRRVDELLLNLDGYLRDNAPPKLGMSLVVAVFDRRDRILEYAVAGHPFPFLHRNGEVTDLPGRPGVLLSMPFVIGNGYERLVTELSPGDSLVFFTDGLVEVPIDAPGTQLGRDGLRRCVEEMVQTDRPAPAAWLVERVRSLDIGPEADDDRTAVLVTIT